MSTSFQQWAETAQQIAETPGIPAKISLCAAYLRSINTDQDLRLAARFLNAGVFPCRSGKRIAIGSRTYSTCAAEFCEIDYEQVFKPCKNALGNASETVEKLMQNIKVARAKRSPAGLSLSDTQQDYEKLSQLSGRAEKKNILESVWKKMTPVEIKYFIRIMKGSLGIGLISRHLISAIAEAFGQKTAEVQYTYMITGSMGRTALLCKDDKLNEAYFSLFHPLSFMSASPVDNDITDDLEHYVAEEKFNGLRAQAHISENRVKLYSADRTDITDSFPDVAQLFTSRHLPDIVLDGVVCVYRNHEILPSQLLQKRIKKKSPRPDLLKKYPVLFIAFDIVFLGDKLISDKPLIRRRQLLEELSEKHPFPVANQFAVPDQDSVKKLFNRSLAHGNEGLILKHKESPYKYGPCSESWLKIKKPGGSLNTVVMYAHTESGEQGNRYSNFTLGVRVAEDERYEEEFIPIGKATCNGLEDKEIKRLNERVREFTVERYGPTLGLIPKIVVELKFDDIKLNKRTKANYVLYQPHVKTIRWDSDPAEAVTLKEVEHLYHKKMNQDRLKQDQNPSFYINKNSESH